MVTDNLSSENTQIGQIASAHRLQNQNKRAHGWKINKRGARNRIEKKPQWIKFFPFFFLSLIPCNHHQL